MERISSTASPRAIPVLLFQALAGANVKDCCREKDDRSGNENDVKHEVDSLVLVLGAPVYSASQNLTRIARLTRFSVFLRSGVHRPNAPQPVAGATLPSEQTNAVGLPLLPPGGVIPPAPDQYGTLAAR